MRISLTLFSMLWTAALALALPIPNAVAQNKTTITITLVNGHPPALRWVRHLQETFVPAVEQALTGSNITLRWKQQYGGTLAKVGEELAAIQNGIADIALVPTIFEPAKMPLQNISYYTPFVSTDPGLVTDAVQAVQRKLPGMAQAWADNDVLYIGGGFALDDYYLFTKFALNSLDDLKGRKLGTPGTSINWLRGTGAVGVATNITEYYTSLQTGLFDGVLTFATAAVPIKLQEVAPYITRIGYGAQYAGGLAVNRDWYEAQPPALQAALVNGAQAFEQAYIADLRQAAQAALQTLIAQGGQLNPASDRLRLEYAQQMENPSKRWISELEKQGLPARQVLNEYMQQVRAVGAQPLRQWDQE